jgi:hypothetical protein
MGCEGKHTARTRDASSCPSCLPQESREGPSGRLEGLDLRRVACQSIIKGRGMKKTYRVKSSCLLSWWLFSGRCDVFSDETMI